MKTVIPTIGFKFQHHMVITLPLWRTYTKIVKLNNVVTTIAQIFIDIATIGSKTIAMVRFVTI